MRIIRDFQFVETHDRHATIAIGNFDGVHLGHQSVIGLARDAAPNAPLGVLTFEPHPRDYFSRGSVPFRLMSSAARASRLAKLGVDRLYELPFNSELAGLTPEEFAKDVLVDGIGPCHAVIGADFCFGQGRRGMATDLQSFGQQYGFGVTVAPLLAHEAQTVSSTAIRAALSAGDPHAAAAMLGHWHRIEGPVIGGEQRGRKLGYPTANQSLDGLHLPAFGVYAVLVDILDGPYKASYRAVSSLGVRPMFGENKPNLETHLFDFKGDLYGTQISVGLVAHLRPEAKFDGLDALIAQMDHDSEKARQILNAL